MREKVWTLDLNEMDESQKKEFKEYYAKKYNTSEHTILKIIKDKKRNPKTVAIRQKKSDSQYMKKYYNLKSKRKMTITMSDFDRRNNKYVGFTSKIHRRLVA